MMKEFREFMDRGSVLDLAVGLVIGLAFGRIVTSVVTELLDPLVGLFLGRGLSDWFYVLGPETYPTLESAREAGALAFGYGTVIQVVIEFILIAFVLFLVVKAYNRTKRKREALPTPPPKEQLLLEEIRDLLRAQS